MACNITVLAPGTVVFEDVGTEYFKGQVLKPLDRNKSSAGGPGSPTAEGQPQQQQQQGEGEVLNGRVKYRGPNHSEEEVQFGEKDQVRVE